MQYGTLREKDTGRMIVERVYRARSLPQRMRGLLGRGAMPDSEAMFFPDCRMIHMFGMRMAIDVVFLDADGKVVAIVPELLPWRIACCYQPGGCPPRNNRGRLLGFSRADHLKS